VLQAKAVCRGTPWVPTPHSPRGGPRSPAPKMTRTLVQGLAQALYQDHPDTRPRDRYCLAGSICWLGAPLANGAPLPVRVRLWVARPCWPSYPTAPPYWQGS